MKFFIVVAAVMSSTPVLAQETDLEKLHAQIQQLQTTIAQLQTQNQQLHDFTQAVRDERNNASDQAAQMYALLAACRATPGPDHR